jgi:nitrate reductase NapE component
MTEQDLIKLWNDKRRQLISAQMHSVITLAVFSVLAVMGYFDTASNFAKLFALLTLGTIGALGILTQFAVIRESKMLIEDLSQHDDLSAIGKSIAASAQYLVFTQVMMIIFSVALLIGFGLVVA